MTPVSSGNTYDAAPATVLLIDGIDGMIASVMFGLPAFRTLYDPADDTGNRIGVDRAWANALYTITSMVLFGSKVPA